jgi:hypothetical protein
MIWVLMLSAVLLISGLKTTSAQQYFNYVGKVVSLSGKSLSVQGSKGDVMYFAIGRKTIYVPAHLPAVGERVKVSYFFRKGHNVAYQVEILPPPPPPSAPQQVQPSVPPSAPPAPTTTITPAPEETKEKKSIFGCARGCSPWGSKGGSK